MINITEEKLNNFESTISKIIHDTRGLLDLLKSVRDIETNCKDSQLYRITLKRFRDNCLKLASYTDSYGILLGDEARDTLLKKHNCTWDSEKKRVSVG